MLDWLGAVLYLTGMNRIAKLREQRGLTQAELAKLAHTTQPQIQRLERGERRLTEDWMKRIAAALDVDPADLLEVATKASFRDEVEPFLPDALRDIAKPLKARALRYFTVLRGSVELAGIAKGKVVLVDGSVDALAQLRTGDCVLVQIDFGEGRPVRVLRQFVAPSLLTTNRKGRNTSFSTEGETFGVKVLGVVVSAEPSAD